MFNNNPNNYNPMMFYMMLNMMNNMNPGMGYNTNNYNINNIQNNMNLMMNWMNMYPILFQMYQSMMNNQYFNMNQNNNYMTKSNNNDSFNENKMSLIRVSEQDLNQAKVTGGGVISKKIINNTPMDISPNSTDLKTNIAFTTQKGQKIMVVAPVNMKIKDLFVNYITRLGLGPNVLGDSIFFLFNGAQISKNDNRTVEELGLISGSIIIVLDLKGVIGS